MNWFVYLLLCGDGSLYCGITNRPSQRLFAHQNGTGARYTQMRGVLTMRIIACCLTHSAAAKMEYQVKRLPRRQKQMLWQNGIVVAN